jgi:hypothetical protein
MKTVGNILLVLGVITTSPILGLVLDVPVEVRSMSLYFGLQALVAGVSVKRHPAPGETLAIMAVATGLALWPVSQGKIFLGSVILLLQVPLLWLVQRNAKRESA